MGGGRGGREGGKRGRKGGGERRREGGKGRAVLFEPYHFSIRSAASVDSHWWPNTLPTELLGIPVLHCTKFLLC